MTTLGLSTDPPYDCNHRWAALYSIADLQRQRSQVVAGDTVSAVGDVADAPHIVTLRDDVVHIGQHRLAPQIRNLLLGRLQLRQQFVDPIGQLIGLHLERLAQSHDERPFLGEIAERLNADERFDTANAGPHTRLRR
jgi:hypothetical protein